MKQKRVTGKFGYKLWLILGDTIFRKYYRQCVSSLNLQGNEKVMDFGCGPGLVSKHFAENLPCGSLTCFEVSEAAIDLAKKRLKAYQNVEYILGDIREAQCLAASYDVVFLNFVYYHIEKYQRVDVMAKLAKLLRDNGILVIRNAVSKHGGMSQEEIKRELKQVSFREVSSEMVKSLFIISTYVGCFSKLANRPDAGDGK